MKDFFVGVIGTIAFFSILYLPIDAELKNLLIGVLCLIILLLYIAIWKALNYEFSLNQIFVFSLPTLLMVVWFLINFIFQLDIGAIYIWVMYAVLTPIALRISLRLGPN